MKTLTKKEVKGVPLAPAMVTPGEILREEFMVPMKLSARELARRMQVTPMCISEIMRGKRCITAISAIRLGRALGTSAQLWLGLQMDHDLAKATIKEAQICG